MSHESQCSFCETLPGTVRPGWGGRPSKCPLCKQELWVSQGGTTYRLGGAAPASSKRLHVVVSLSVLAGVVLIATLGAILVSVGQKPTPAPTVAKMEPVTLPSKPIHRDAPEVTGPSVQAKTALHTGAARAKPSAKRPDFKEPAPPPVRAVAETTPRPPEKPAVVAKGSGGVTLATGKPVIALPRVDLESLLRDVPEVDLDPHYLKRSKSQVAENGLEIAKQNKTNKDAFVKKLMKERQDLAGLPFLLGKDCSMSPKEAQVLAMWSLGVRAALAKATKPAQSMSYSYSEHFDAGIESAGARFWSTMSAANKSRLVLKTESLGAFHQILTAEDRDFRLGWVVNLGEIKDAKSTEMLINRALFDLDPEVRLAALIGPVERPKDQYADALKRALRYPWHPVVQNAALAIAVLDRKEMIPDLVALLDEPDPRAPFAVKGDDGKVKTMVRELVRINHHRNCMLCHAPVDVAGLSPQEQRDLRNMPVGPAPSPDEPLPPSSSTIYYAPRKGVTLVRADVTYLRQDFSLRQRVDDPGKWPEMQRFDFLVRTRELTAKEFALQPEFVLHIEYKEAITDALRALTGKDAPPNAKAWREALALPDPSIESKLKARP